MHLRSSILVLGLLASSIAAAQTQAHLEFDSAKHVTIYSSVKPPTDKPDDTQDVSDTSADLKLPAAGSLYVWDTDSGNVASKPVDQVGKKWHIADKEFNRIGLVTVHVDYQGEPVASAQVTLKDAKREQSQLLDSASNGEADFYVVEPGKQTVTVQYRSNGSAASPVVQQFSLDLQHKDPNPDLKIELPNAVETIAPKAPLTQTTNSAPTSKPIARSNPLGTLFVFLIILLFAVGLAWALYTLAKKHPDWFHAKLKQLDVDVPDHPQPVAADAEQKPIPTLTPVQPQPQSKIILDDGALPPAPAIAAAPMPGQVVNHEPRLVKPSGEFVNLPEGETVVGREDNLGVSLVGESSVSRRHASITRQGQLITLRDLGSTNGTYVNGRKISADTQLSHGDDVQFGAVKFRVEGR